MANQGQRDPVVEPRTPESVGGFVPRRGWSEPGRAAGQGLEELTRAWVLAPAQVPRGSAGLRPRVLVTTGRS